MSYVWSHLEHEKQKGDSWEIHTTCQHCHPWFPTPFNLQCHIESVTHYPGVSVMFANCHSKQTRLSYITWRTIVSLAKCPMWARFAIIDCQLLLIKKHVLEHAMKTLRICFVLSISTLSEPSYFTWIIVRALEKESFSVPNAGYSVWPQRRKHSIKPRIIELLKSQSNWKRCLLKQRLWFKLQFN